MIDKEIEEYLGFLHSKNRSAGTIGLYKTKLYSFRNFIKKSINMCNLLSISSYIQFKDKEIKRISENFERKRDALSSHTKNLIIQALKGFFYFHNNDKMFREVKKMRIEKTPKRVPVHITKDQIHKMLSKNIHQSERLQERDNLLMLFLYTTGARRGELKSLYIDHLKLSTPIKEDLLAIVRGKGDKDDYIKIPKWWIKIYKDYYEKYRAESKFIFEAKNGEPMSVASIYKIIKEKARMAGIEFNEAAISPHKMRSTFASELVESGEDIRVIQTLLRHASIASTQIYTKVSKKRLMKVKSPEIKGKSFGQD